MRFRWYGRAAVTPPAAIARKSLAFRWVAGVFVALLAIGFALGVVVYRRYVAYEPVAARHVPGDAFGSARFDLTHVMLYEPFRRSIFPLVDALPNAASANGRRARLERRGVQVSGQVREVVTAFGPAANDWVLVLGGTLPSSGVPALLAEVLRAEGLPVTAAERSFSLGGTDALSVGQAGDGAVVIASSAERLRAAIPERDAAPVLGRAAGGMELSGAWVPRPFRGLRVSFRAGSVLAVELHAPFSVGSDPAVAEIALRELLRNLAAGAPHATRAVAEARFRRSADELEAELALPREAVEELATRVAERLEGR